MTCRLASAVFLGRCVIALGLSVGAALARGLPSTPAPRIRPRSCRSASAESTCSCVLPSQLRDSSALVTAADEGVRFLICEKKTTREVRVRRLVVGRVGPELAL